MARIEYAGGATLSHINESRAGILARAPLWWRQRAAAGMSSPVAAPARPSATLPARPAVARRSAGWGWVAGVCAAGLSVRVFGHTDKQTLPEQFTPDCWRHILRQVSERKRPVELRLGHDGPVIATTDDGTLSFRLHALFGMGLVFTARVPVGGLPAASARAVTTDGMGVSVGYVMPEQWVSERDGIGPVRVVNRCVLDHIALIAPGGTLRAAYPASRCFGIAGQEPYCPPRIRDRAEVFAFNELKRQAGCKV
jgi:hypothetical protein